MLVKYVGGTDNTVPFTEAPACVRKALDLIKERAYLGLQLDEPFNFNEVLSAAYLERQKMSVSGALADRSDLRVTDL